jgi:carboxylesterase
VKVDARPFRLGPVGGEGPAVVCLHGLTGTPYEVRQPAEGLAEAGFACLGPELPGHGQTPEDLIPVHRSDWVEAALGAWDELSRTHSRVYVLGLSLGGVLALRVATERPVAGVVALAAPVRLRRRVRWGLPLLARLLESVPKTPAILDPEARQRHPGYARMPLAPVRELIRLGEEVLADLAAISAPLRLLYSTGDPTVDPSNAELILERVSSKNRGVDYLHRSAHVLPVDYDRDEVARRCVEFLSGLERESR